MAKARERAPRTAVVVGIVLVMGAAVSDAVGIWSFRQGASAEQAPAVESVGCGPLTYDSVQSATNGDFAQGEPNRIDGPAFTVLAHRGTYP